MIESVDRRLQEWIGGVLDGVEVTAAAPSDDQPGKGVCVYLLELCEPEDHRGGRPRPPMLVRLRYLISTWAETPLEAHRMLGVLIFAALEEGEFEVEHEIPLATWQAFGVSPRPAFAIVKTLRRERPAEVVPLVRAPLVMKPTPAITLYGAVMGPEDVPVARATVELPALSLKVVTDSNGRFRIPMVPADPPEKELRVHARGHLYSINADTGQGGDGPLLIHLDL